MGHGTWTSRTQTGHKGEHIGKTDKKTDKTGREGKKGKKKGKKKKRDIRKILCSRLYNSI